MSDTAGEISFQASKLVLRWSRNLPLNNDDITLTGMKNPLRHDTQRSSEDKPPPVTTQCT